MVKMTFEEFQKYVEENLLENRNEFATAKVAVTKVVKNNGKELTGLSIIEENSKISPTIYLEYHYTDYTDGKSIEECMEDIVETYHKHKVANFDVSMLEDYAKVKDNLCLKMVNREMNEEFLKDKPHLLFGDLAVIFQIKAYKMGEIPMEGTITVNSEMSKAWNVDTNTILADALVNSQKECQIVSMFVFTDEDGNTSIGKEALPAHVGPGMYVLSTKNNVNGAVGMLNLDLIQEFAERSGKNVYIIPSSIHECILVPDFGRIGVEELQMMCREVNATQVAPEEVLSDNIYFYNRSNGEIFRTDTNEKLTLTVANI